jgi:uncharacterized membrane-anchored protein
MNVGLIILLWVAFAACWLWLVIRVFSASGLLAGILAFICWPVAIIDTIKHWNDPPNSVARPFFATLLAFAALWTFALRFQVEVMEAHEAMLAKGDGGVLGAAEGDPESMAMRLRQAMSRLQVQRGEVSIPQAHATLAIPQHFRLVPKRSIEALAAELGGYPPDPDLFGWLVHDSVDVADDDAWFIEVHYNDVGHVSESDPEELGGPELVAANREVTDRYAGGEYRFESFAHAPTWREDIGTLAWGETLSYSDEPEALVDCYAVKPTREGVIEFVVEYMEKERSELCLRSVRLMAASTRFDPGWAWEDYSFWRDKRSGSDFADVVTGAVFE